MKFKQSRLLIAGGAVLGLVAGAAIAIAQADSGPRGELPPIFGPDNPAPSTDITYQQSSQELWARSFDLDQLFVRTAGLPPACGDECLIDNAPEELGHLFEVACNSIDKIQYDALYPSPDRELGALHNEAQGDCAEVLDRIAETAHPDPTDPDWRTAAQAWHATLNQRLEDARPVVEMKTAGDHE